uniref:DNA repair protein complementing XP-G cells n=1 Tax=Steinernema glaseri TaxID=37863 RepID=A0A1I7YN76_9BILA
MGVPGLWSLLEPTGQPITLESLEGKRLAIDVSLWLHQAAEGYLRHEVTLGHGARNPHLALLLHRISKLLYYKVRPVFVFDVFKQHILRERRLKHHVEELTISRDQRRMLSNIAQSQSKTAPKKFSRKATTEKEDLFALPSTSTANIDHSSRSDPCDLGTFAESLSADDRIRLLLDSRERARNERLTPAQIPEDSDDFSRFQIQRLLQRSKITSQLDMLCKEKKQQYAMPLTKSETSRVMFDGGNRGHMLTRHDDIEIINSENEERNRILKESITWPALLNQMREEYEGIRSSHVIPASTTKNVQHVTIRPDEDSDEQDDAFQEAILLSLCEESYGKGSCDRPTPSSESSAEHSPKRNAEVTTETKRVDMHSDSWDSDDFVDVAEPCSSKVASALPSFSSSLPSTSQTSQRNEEEGVYADCQKLLNLCGIPYVLAPGEAEAQCAELEQLGLVDGVVTDDSDIWLFGGKTVYRNMFHRKKRVHKYNSSTAKDVLGLTRSEFIQLAMLSGGDYSRGFEGVGIVTALELIAEFSKGDGSVTAIDVLNRIREWLDAKEKCSEKNFIESKTKSKLRRYLETNNNREVLDKFPNRNVLEAYSNPLVDRSEERFNWGTTCFEPMYKFVWQKLGWDESKVRSATNKAFERWSEFLKSDVRRYQTRITAFMEQPLEKLAAEQRLAPSSRAVAALRKLVERKGATLSEMLLPQPKSKANESEDANDSFNESEDDWMLSQPPASSVSRNDEPSLPSSGCSEQDMVLIGNKKFAVSTVRKLRDAVRNLNSASAVEVPSNVQPMMFRTRKKTKRRGPVEKKKRFEDEADLKLSESDSDD